MNRSERQWDRHTLITAVAIVWFAHDHKRVAAADFPVIEKVSGVRSLTYDEANQSRPVKLQGVITYSHGFLAFVQDETGGVYFSPHTAKVLPEGSPRDLKPGMLVQLEGLTIPGGYAPCVGKQVVVTILGKAPMPKALEVPKGQLLKPDLDMQWIALEATALGARIDDEVLRVDLVCNGTRINAEVTGDWKSGNALSRLVGSDVRITGVYGGIPNHSRQLIGMRVFCPSIDHIEILDEGLSSAFAEPAHEVAELMRYHPDGQGRVNLAGVVLASFPDHRLFVRGKERAIEIKTLNVSQLEPGQKITAAGFPTPVDGHVVLRDAVVRKLWKTLPPTPIEFRRELLEQDMIHGELISIEGVVVEHFHSLVEPIIVLKADGRLFSAKVPRSISPISPGSHIVTIGICLMNPGVGVMSTSSSGSFVIARDPDEDYTFTIHARDENDLAVIREPSWWTRERLQAIGGILAVIVAATAFWGFALQLKVREQTLTISEKLEKERLSEERVRIAQELHDTLQQELVGIGLQLDNAAARLKKAPPLAAESIELARVMLRQSQADARRSIWDLHADAGATGNLASKLQTMAIQFKADSGPELVISVDDELQNVPGSIASQYLRIAQEAIANAIKHAQAKTISLRLFRVKDELRLEVRDDGIGFCLNAIPGVSDGHLGLSGMQQRARRLSGTFEIDSKPGRGTLLSLATRVNELQH